MPDSAQYTYSRRTIIAAADMLKALGHSGFDRFLLELELPEDTAGRGSSLMGRANSLAEFVLRNPDYMSPRGRTVALDIVGRAAEIWRSNSMNNVASRERDEFAAAMRQDGQGLLLERSQPAAPEHRVEEATMAPETGPDRSEAIAFGPTIPLPEMPVPRASKIFIVHGHDEAALQSVARFVERLGLEAIVLREQPDQGRTVIEKFENCAAQVGFAIVLLTPDDPAAVSAGRQQAPRARQNVVFELGYFAGKLGRGRACLLRKGDVEIPSDLYGVVYTEIDSGEGWKAKLARELEAAKFDFDAQRVWK